MCALLVLLTVSSCATNAGTTAAANSAKPSPPVPTRLGAAPSTAPSLASCGATRLLPALRTVHHFSVSPDDITVDGNGRLWVTARSANLLVSMSATGGGTTTQTVGGGPEGVAADGSTLYVAQQDRNAVAIVTTAARTLISFAGRGSNAGIDGIAVDAANHQLLVPDSPTGQLFAVNLTGDPVATLLGEGLGRPVAAVADGSGNLFVASESTPGLTVLPTTGGKHTLGGFSNLDEVVFYAGLLYVTDLDHHDVLAVDPTTGQSVAVASGLPAPQGLAVTSAGILEIVDATTNTLYSTPACGVAA